jgi:XRE family aerobic/anaerobic benzoate catabolism transcriptional regulator
MATDICILVGRRIKELRKARGWRQIDLAEQAGLNENYISDLEIGKKEICLRAMQSVARALSVKTADLLTVDE